MTTTKLVILPHPYTDKRIEKDIDPGISISEAIKQSPIKLPKEFNAVVQASGYPIPKKRWDTRLVKEGEEIMVNVVPQFGLDWAAIFIYAIVSAIISAGITLAVNALLRRATEKPDDPLTAADNPGLKGIRNSVLIDKAVWRIFGKRKVFPPHAAQQYTETSGDIQTLKAVFCLGYGTYDITQLELAGTPFSALLASGLEYNIYEHPAEQPVIYPNRVDFRGLSHYTEPLFWLHEFSNHPGYFQVANHPERGAPSAPSAFLQSSGRNKASMWDAPNQPTTWGGRRMSKPWIKVAHDYYDGGVTDTSNPVFIEDVDDADEISLEFHFPYGLGYTSGTSHYELSQTFHLWLCKKSDTSTRIPLFPYITVDSEAVTGAGLFTVTEDPTGTDVTKAVTVADGGYSGFSLCSALQTALNDDTDLSGTYTVTWLHSYTAGEPVGNNPSRDRPPGGASYVDFSSHFGRVKVACNLDFDIEAGFNLLGTAIGFSSLPLTGSNSYDATDVCPFGGIGKYTAKINSIQPCVGFEHQAEPLSLQHNLTVDTLSTVVSDEPRDFIWISAQTREAFRIGIKVRLTERDDYRVCWTQAYAPPCFHQSKNPGGYYEGGPEAHTIEDRWGYVRRTSGTRTNGTSPGVIQIWRAGRFPRAWGYDPDGHARMLTSRQDHHIYEEGQGGTGDRTVSTWGRCNWETISSIAFEDPVEINKTVTLIEVSIKQSELVSGIIDSFSCVAESKLSKFDGSSWGAPVATQNAAWAMAEILRGEANRESISDSRIMGQTFLDFANYNEPTAGNYFHSFNFIFDNVGSVRAALDLVAASSRGSYVSENGIHSVIWDRPQTTAVMHITEANSRNVQGEKFWPTIPHLFRMRFANEADDYEKDEKFVYRDGYGPEDLSSVDVKTWDFTSSTTDWFAGTGSNIAAGATAMVVTETETDGTSSNAFLVTYTIAQPHINNIIRMRLKQGAFLYSQEWSGKCSAFGASLSTSIYNNRETIQGTTYTSGVNPFEDPDDTFQDGWVEIWWDFSDNLAFTVSGTGGVTTLTFELTIGWDTGIHNPTFEIDWVAIGTGRGNQLEATIYEVLENQGITNHREITREAYYRFGELEKRAEIVTVDMDWEYMVGKRGDTVWFAHSLPGNCQMAGRITEVITNPDTGNVIGYGIQPDSHHIQDFWEPLLLSTETGGSWFADALAGTSRTTVDGKSSIELTKNGFPAFINNVTGAGGADWTGYLDWDGTIDTLSFLAYHASTCDRIMVRLYSSIIPAKYHQFLFNAGPDGQWDEYVLELGHEDWADMPFYNSSSNSPTKAIIAISIGFDPWIPNSTVLNVTDIKWTKNTGLHYVTKEDDGATDRQYNIRARANDGVTLYTPVMNLALGSGAPVYTEDSPFEASYVSFADTTDPTVADEVGYASNLAADVDDIIIFSDTKHQSQQMLISDIVPSEDMQAQLVLIPAAYEIFDPDVTTVHPYSSANLSSPHHIQAPPTPIFNQIVADRRDMVSSGPHRGNAVSYVADLTISWHLPQYTVENTERFAAVDKYQLQFVGSDQFVISRRDQFGEVIPWQDIAIVPSNITTINHRIKDILIADDYPSEMARMATEGSARQVRYSIRLRSISAGGIDEFGIPFGPTVSPWVEETDGYLSGNSSLDGPIHVRGRRLLTEAYNFRGFELQWRHPNPSDVDYYLVTLFVDRGEIILREITHERKISFGLGTGLIEPNRVLPELTGGPYPDWETSSTPNYAYGVRAVFRDGRISEATTGTHNYEYGFGEHNISHTGVTRWRASSFDPPPPHGFHSTGLRFKSDIHTTRSITYQIFWQQYDLASSTQGEAPHEFSPYLDSQSDREDVSPITSWLIDIYDETTNYLLRTEEVESNIVGGFLPPSWGYAGAYAYTHEDNVNDNINVTGQGYASRNIRFEFRSGTHTGRDRQYGSRTSKFSFYHPAPPPPVFTALGTVGNIEINLAEDPEWVYGQDQTDFGPASFRGTIAYGSTAGSSFTPSIDNMIGRSDSKDYVIGTDVRSDLWIKLVQLDRFVDITNPDLSILDTSGDAVLIPGASLVAAVIVETKDTSDRPFFTGSDVSTWKTVDEITASVTANTPIQIGAQAALTVNQLRTSGSSDQGGGGTQLYWRLIRDGSSHNGYATTTIFTSQTTTMSIPGYFPMAFISEIDEVADISLGTHKWTLQAKWEPFTYSAGTVSINTSSNVVTGTGTFWRSFMVPDALWISNPGYQIVFNGSITRTLFSLTNNTSLAVNSNVGSTDATATYVITDTQAQVIADIVDSAMQLRNDTIA